MSTISVLKHCEESYMKNLLLIAFATLALSLGANVLNACPACEGKTTVNAENKAEAKSEAKTDKAEVKTEKVVTDANKKEAKVEVKTDAKTDTKVVTDVKKAEGCSGCGTCTKASAGQTVKADKDCSGSCSKAAAGQSTKADGGCGGGCGGCDKSSGDCGSCNKAEKKDCEGCKTSEKVVKN